MSKIIVIGLICCLGVGSFSQTQIPTNTDLRVVEMYSAWVGNSGNTEFDDVRSLKSCLDLLLLVQKCYGPDRMRLSYGGRFGNNWDIFGIDAIRDSQTRMIDLGDINWTDKIVVPIIEPWAKLGPGEHREVRVDASGINGRNGSSGTNGQNGSSPSDPKPLSGGNSAVLTEKRAGVTGSGPVAQQVNPYLTGQAVVVKAGNYSPFNNAIKGHMYAIHVVVPGQDYYLLLRVDDLLRGDKVTVSWKKI